MQHRSLHAKGAGYSPARVDVARESISDHRPAGLRRLDSGGRRDALLPVKFPAACPKGYIAPLENMIGQWNG